MGKILLKNAKLLDWQYDYLPADVELCDGKITAVGSGCGSDAEEVYDLSGCTLMPGFFNAHLHLLMDDYVLPEEQFAHMVQRGITAVRDLSALGGISPEDFMALKRTWNTPNHPTVFTSCKIIAVENGYGDRTPDGIQVGLKAETPDQAEALAGRVLSCGADGIKIGIQAEREEDPGVMPREMVRALGAAAKAHGVWLAAHVTRADFLKRLVEDGITEAAHVPGDPVSDEVFAEMVRKGVILTPTISVYDHPSMMAGPGCFDHAVDNVARFRRAGGTVTLGTDCMPHPENLSAFDMPMAELGYLRRAGMTPREIVVAATRNSALACGAADRLGSVAVGMLASLIAVPGELDSDMEKMDHVVFVMNRGVVVKRPR